MSTLRIPHLGSSSANLHGALLAALMGAALMGCSSPRLGNAEIDQACDLIARCGGLVDGCVTDLIDARGRADESGCAAQFAAANRCYIRADSCSTTAACAEASDALVACGTAPRDAGARDGGGVIVISDSGGDWVSEVNAVSVALITEMCAICPSFFTAEDTCAGPFGLSAAQQDCVRAVADVHPEVRYFNQCLAPFTRVFNECLLDATRTTCPPVATSCVDAYEAGVGTCGTLSETANAALRACLP